jgi:hypothetical protein
VVAIPKKIEGLPVIEIGKGAFEGKGLTKITLPQSIGKIGDRAFANNRLSAVTIPDMVYGIPVTRIAATSDSTVKYIGNGTFNFTTIQNLTLPAGLAEIDDGAFLGFTIQQVIFPNDSVKELWNRAYPGIEKGNQALAQKWELANQQQELAK